MNSLKCVRHVISTGSCLLLWYCIAVTYQRGKMCTVGDKDYGESTVCPLTWDS